MESNKQIDEILKAT